VGVYIYRILSYIEKGKTRQDIFIHMHIYIERENI
jgi:hypothetical protein